MASKDKSDSKLSRRLERLFRSQVKPMPSSQMLEANLGENAAPSSFPENPTVFPEIRYNEQLTSTIPEVRRCYEWSKFINRFGKNDAPYAIETLITGSGLRKDMLEEYKARCEKNIYGYDVSEFSDSSTPIGIKTASTWTHCVRIQSPSLLKIFDRVTNYGLGTRPLTFKRPFRYMIHFHGQLKDEFKKMESEYFESNQRPSIKSNRSRRKRDDPTRDTSSITSGESQRRKSLKSATRVDLEDLRCYVSFVETEILPLMDQFDHGDFSHPYSIRFSDLWYLFKPGELIYMPTSSIKKHMERMAALNGQSTLNDLRPGAQQPSSVHQNIVRLLHTLPAQKNRDVPEDQGLLKELYDNFWSDRGPFWLACYYLDYDGSSYAPIQCMLEIEYFEGERDIRELEFYPIRFAPDAESCLRNAKSIGLKYTEYVSQKHMSYSGWDVVTSPLGEIIPDPAAWPDPALMRPSFIESEVIIDFKETFNSIPIWKDWAVVQETFKQLWHGKAWSNVQSRGPDLILDWSSRDRTMIVSCMEDIMVCDDGIIAILEHDTAVARDPYLRSESSSSHKPSGEDLALLPGRLFAYALRERRFLQVNIQRLKPIPHQTDVFDRLELPDHYRRTITALMDSHFDKKRIECHEGLITQDFIYGKGGGLVIMLHGEPGVGKTATAEALAQKYERPLFSITCGDLGVEPRQVEASLNEIFRLANLWDCILLLDEAEIFLTARNANDLARNGIVTIFLRMMDYYNGVLIMTTNRIGKLDSAIVSRVHLTLEYKRFGEEELRNVFKLNIQQMKRVEEQRAGESGQLRLHVVESEVLQFASEHYHRHKDSPQTSCWNGRQIRNAFQVASSLARQDQTNRSSVRPPQLGARHFEEVERFTSDFDRFRTHLMGGDDSYLALKREERFDVMRSAGNERSGGGKSLSSLLATPPRIRKD